MRARAAAAVTATVLAAGLLAAPPAAAQPSPGTTWPSPGADTDPSKERSATLSGSAVSLQPDATRKPLVVVETGQEKGGQSITIPADVLFDKDSAELSDNASANLDSVVNKLQSDGVTGDVKIIGHTDDTGTTAHNLTLSKQRAKAVNDALGEKLRNSGINLTWSGVGEKGPLEKNDSEAHRKRNRRVAIVYKQSPTSTNTTDSYDFSVPLTQSVTKAPGAPSGAIASAQRSVDMESEGDYTVRMYILGLKRQNGLLRLDFQTELASQAGTTSFDDIGQLFSGTYDVTHEDDMRAGLFDPVKKQQLGPLITGKGDVVGNIGYGDTLGVRGIRQGYLYFPEPTTGATKLSLYVPAYGTFDDLPIS